MNKVFAVIVTYNPSMSLLEKEYLSIVNQVEKIVYVDNGSENCDKIKEWHSKKTKTDFFCLGFNAGLGYAQNMGIKKALSEDASHIVIFDQDTVVNDDFLYSLLDAEKKALKEGVNVGLTGPVYKSPDGYIYPVLSIESGKIVKKDARIDDKYCLVSHIIASGSLIRRDVIDKVGLMNEDLFLGFIDFDYCFRANQKGFQTIVTNRACMHHQMGDSQIELLGRKIGIYSPFRRYFDCRNTILIQRSLVFPKVFRRYYLKLIIGKVLISLIYGPQRFKQLRYCSKGFYDGFLGRTGRCSIECVKKYC